MSTPAALAHPVRRLAAPALALAGVAGAFAYVGAVDPHEPGHYPACPLLRLTGLYCPGCGGLRSAHAVAHGDLAAAFQDNALAVLGYGLAAVLWLVWTVRAARGRDLAPPLPPARLRWALAAVVLAFTLVRNLPLGGFLHP
ncbi:DUF2752 domain-containing protein [Streptomyces sp. SPB074]|uniref:DUF2752 domain-containing protein n=1 Tax=Streptomyces sp. (strain SPB074) TaxID=465543 RepID=UPI0001D1DCB0|nr:DUF2752 domain-containing protein [Streptomyces sp. SPB074]EFG65424.1 membrane protein [Streptomyces sp. SPB074]